MGNPDESMIVNARYDEPEYTEGPWEIFEDSRTEKIKGRYKSRRTYSVWRDSDIEDRIASNIDNKTNALLISLVPEMYEALQKIAQASLAPEGVREIAQNVLVKITHSSDA